MLKHPSLLIQSCQSLCFQQRRLCREFSPVTQAQLEDIVPCSAISRHLAELAHLYEATSPTIANIYVLIASLSPESLPQGSTGAA